MSQRRRSHLHGSGIRFQARQGRLAGFSLVCFGVSRSKWTRNARGHTRGPVSRLGLGLCVSGSDGMGPPWHSLDAIPVRWGADWVYPDDIETDPCSVLGQKSIASFAGPEGMAMPATLTAKASAMCTTRNTKRDGLRNGRATGRWNRSHFLGGSHANAWARANARIVPKRRVRDGTVARSIHTRAKPHLPPPERESNDWRRQCELDVGRLTLGCALLGVACGETSQGTCMGLFGLGLPEVAVIAGVAALIFGTSEHARMLAVGETTTLDGFAC